MTETVSPAAFSEYSAQDNALAVREAQEWIEAVTGRRFKSSFRESLEDGILLCELMSKLKPGSIRKINKSKSPIAHLDNIQQFLSACQDLGLKDAQLFDTMDLQDAKGKKKTGVKRNEADRRVRSVCITLYWLGEAMAEQEDYTGPQLDLKAFRRIMRGVLEDSDEDNNGPISNQHHVHFQLDVGQSTNPSSATNGVENGFGLTFEQEQTADQLMADIQSAVDEMLHDFEMSPVPDEVSPRTPSESKRLGVSLHMSSRNGGFGFQVYGGTDIGTSPRVELILEGSAAEDAGLMTGDELVSVNKQDISQLTHLELVSLIKKAGEEGSVLLGLIRTVSTNDTVGVGGKNTVPHTSKSAPPTAKNPVTKTSQPQVNNVPSSSEKKAQPSDISSMYPDKTLVTTDNKSATSRPPPTTYMGGAPLDTLVETQDEALLEQINEMLQSIPPPESPTPSPPPSPVSQTLSPPDKFAAKNISSKKPPQLQDDRESIERELQEIVLMEMSAANAVADSASLQPALSLNAELQKISSVSPSDSDDLDFDKQISGLLQFAGFESVPKIPSPSPPPVVNELESAPLVNKPELPMLTKPESHQIRETTPPIMLESPPPPMPKTEAPKRQVKSSPPPLTKPKPSRTKKKAENNSSPSTAAKVSLLSKKTRISAAEQKDPPKPTQLQLSNGPFATAPGEMKQNEPPAPARSRVVFTPPPPPTSPPPANNDKPVSPVQVREIGAVTPENMEIIGDLKTSLVEKKRWTPKGDVMSSPLSPGQTIAQTLFQSTSQKKYTPQLSNNSLPGHYTQSDYMSSNLKRDDPTARMSASTYHLPQHQMNSVPTGVTPATRTQWRSQEELRIRNVQPTKQPTHTSAYRQQSTPSGSGYGSNTMPYQHHQIQKTMSLPRGKTTDTRKKNRPNTWAVRNRGRMEGPQIAYAVHANNPQELCSKCHRPLGSGIVMAIPGPKSQYHVQCFVCRNCQTPLVRGPQNTTVVVKNLQPHCGFCASSSSKGVLMTEC